MTVIVGGFFGEPAEVQIPTRSLRRIQRAIFDWSDHYDEFDRQLAFQAITNINGANISQVMVTTSSLDGRQVDHQADIVYRDGTFLRGKITHAGKERTVHRLTPILEFLSRSNPHE